METVTNITFSPITKVIRLELENGSIYEGKNYSDSNSGMTFKFEPVQVAEASDQHTLHCTICDL